MSPMPRKIRPLWETSDCIQHSSHFLEWNCSLGHIDIIMFVSNVSAMHMHLTHAGCSIRFNPSKMAFHFCCRESISSTFHNGLFQLLSIRSTPAQIAQKICLRTYENDILMHQSFELLASQKKILLSVFIRHQVLKRHFWKIKGLVLLLANSKWGSIIWNKILNYTHLVCKEVSK